LVLVALPLLVWNLEFDTTYPWEVEDIPEEHETDAPRPRKYNELLGNTQLLALILVVERI
jgi:hypothetical protein